MKKMYGQKLGKRVNSPDRLTVDEQRKRIYKNMTESDKDRAAKFEPQILVEYIDSFGKNLNDWEIKFISGLVDSPPAGYSRKQKEIIHHIYLEKCG